MFRGLMAGLRRAGAAVAVALLFAGSPLAAAVAQPPTTAAQDGFLPVDESKQQEQLPAAPLVMAAYALAWLAIVVYVWSLWSRLGKVERELAEVTRRVGAGARR
jgi:CcmD family protein